MTLIVVYNANTGFVNQSLDWLHKVVSPDTYSCSLCKLSHSAFGVKDEWNNFVKNLDFKVEFYHKNEFRNRFPNSQFTFPWIGIQKGNESFKTVLSSENLNQIDSLENLLFILNKKLNQLMVK